MFFCGSAELGPTWRYSGRVYYEITSACNLRCLHCCAYPQTPGQYADVTSIARFHSALTGKEPSSAVITGGEPTLHPGFSDLLGRLDGMGPVVVTTNGTILSVSDAAGLLRVHRNTLLQISIDGLCGPDSGRIRGESARKRALGLLIGLARAGLHRQLGVSFTVMRFNAAEVRSLVQFARELQVFSVHFPALVAVGSGARDWTEIVPPPNQQIEIDDYLVDEMADASGSTAISSGRVQQVLSRVLFGPAADCLNTVTPKVTPTGEILPCPMCSDPQFSLGNISEEHIVERLPGRLSNRLPNLRLRADYEGRECPSCPVRASCNGRFCDVCGLVTDASRTRELRICSTLRHHFSNAIQELTTIPHRNQEGCQP